MGNIYRGVPEDESIGEEGVEESQPTQLPLDTTVGQLAVRAAKRATASLHGSSYKRSWEIKRKDPINGANVAHLTEHQFRSRARPPALKDAPLSLRDGGFRSMARLAAGVDLDAACGPLRLGQGGVRSVQEEESLCSVKTLFLLMIERSTRWIGSTPKRQRATR